MDAKEANGNLHSQKLDNHDKDRIQHQKEKEIRMERHSGTGHGIKESPKKGGGGAGNWGTVKDDITDAKQELGLN